MRGTAFVVVLVAAAAAGSACDPQVGDIAPPACVDTDSDPAKTVDFKTQIRPLMDAPPGSTPRPCADCHYPAPRGTQEGLNRTGLDLSTLGKMRKGANDGPVVVPGSPCKSLVIQKLRGTAAEGAQMPKGGPFWTPEQIQLMSDWIAEGAKGDDAL